MKQQNGANWEGKEDEGGNTTSIHLYGRGSFHPILRNRVKKEIGTRKVLQRIGSGHAGKSLWESPPIGRIHFSLFSVWGGLDETGGY